MRVDAKNVLRVDGEPVLLQCEQVAEDQRIPRAAFALTAPIPPQARESARNIAVAIVQSLGTALGVEVDLDELNAQLDEADVELATAPVMVPALVCWN